MPLTKTRTSPAGISMPHPTNIGRRGFLGKALGGAAAGGAAVILGSAGVVAAAEEPSPASAITAPPVPLNQPLTFTNVHCPKCAALVIWKHMGEARMWARVPLPRKKGAKKAPRGSGGGSRCQERHINLTDQKLCRPGKAWPVECNQCGWRGEAVFWVI